MRSAVILGTMTLWFKVQRYVFCLYKSTNLPSTGLYKSVYARNLSILQWFFVPDASFPLRRYQQIKMTPTVMQNFNTFTNLEL